jgi:hypothetical protein
MSQRPPVLLNGAPIWYPLLGSATLLAVLGVTLSTEGLPFLLSCLSGLVIVANLGILMSCRSAIGQWLGRTKYAEIGVLLSGVVSFIDLFNSPEIPFTTSGLEMFMLLIIMSMSFSLMASYYYIEDSEGRMVGRPKTFGAKKEDVWRDLLQGNLYGICIHSSDKLMQRKLFGPSVIYTAKGMSHRYIEPVAYRNG